MAGLLLEQAAHSHIRRRPARPRKFAFHLLLAGLRFSVCNQGVLLRHVYKYATHGGLAGGRGRAAARGGDFHFSPGIGGRARGPLLNRSTPHVQGGALLCPGRQAGGPPSTTHSPRPAPRRQVLKVYGDQNWRLIQEHMHDTLARHARCVGGGGGGRGGWVGGQSGGGMAPNKHIRSRLE